MVMATGLSLSSLFLSSSPPSLSYLSTTTTTMRRHLLSLRPTTTAITAAAKLFSSSSSSHSKQKTANSLRNHHDDDPQSDSLSSSHKSIAVATGELFIDIAVRLIGSSVRKRSDEIVRNSGEFEYGGRIANVLEDPVQPEVVWEQREKDVEAERKGRREIGELGFSFSAAGLLFPYHLGVAQFFIEKGYIKETTPLAGSSAGAIVSAVIASGHNMQDALQATKMLAEDCRQRGTMFRLGAVLRGVLEEFLPEDAHTKCNGRLRVAITQIRWRPRGLLVDQFDSKEDLINALITSSFIPGYLAPRPVTMFRNQLCMDGGLTLFIPPTSTPQTVRVCAFPARRMGLEGNVISPDCNPENRPGTRQLLNWALEPAEDDILDKLFEYGYSDADVWAKDNPLNMIVSKGTTLVQK